MGQKSLNQLIKENITVLSPGQKKVAEFFIQHKNEAPLLTAFQVGKKVGVSETTVIRLAYALGFSGFSQMQEKLREEWLSSKYPQLNEGLPSSEDEDNNTHLFTKVIEKEQLILKQLLQQQDPTQIWKVVEQITNADRVFIGGFGSSFSAGYWFYFSLKQLRDHVYISNPTGFMTEDMIDLTEKSAVIIFSYPRYRKESMKLAKFAREQNANIIAITNRQLSPIGQVSDTTLTTEEFMESGHHSIASVITLLEIIIAGIHQKDQDNISDRQKKLEMFYTDLQLFLE
jgi:DNA-binding MurR/RpiR family transcriptional regulator